MRASKTELTKALGKKDVGNREDRLPQEAHLEINGRSVAYKPNKTEKGDPSLQSQKLSLLEICRSQGMYLPSLCYHPDLEATGTCRLCLVSIEDDGSGKCSSKLVPACKTEAREGMKVVTRSKEIDDQVCENLWLLRQRHPMVCPTCVADGNCELQDLLRTYDIPLEGDVNVHGEHIGDKHWKHETSPLAPIPRVKPEVVKSHLAQALDKSSPALVLDMEKCVLCLRCVRACSDLQGMDILGPVSRGEMEIVAPMFGEPIANTPCIQCGHCARVCPVGAIYEKPHVSQVWEHLNAVDRSKRVTVVQTAPATRVTISEAFNMAPGSLTQGKLVTLLRRLGFDYVFDTNFCADLTIIEEGYELLGRLKDGGPFPMFTSCCPAWINMVEKTYPQFTTNVSSAKSPQQMFGSIAKSYFAQRIGRDPSEVKVVSIMPCVAKKDEAEREVMKGDVDFVLTTRELGELTRRARPRIHFDALDESDYDSPLGEASGAGVIFGVTGGVMEAALRTAYVLTASKGKDPASLKLEFKEVRGLQGIKEAEIDMHGTSIRVAVAHGGIELRRLCEAIISGEAPAYHFVEMMACRGGEQILRS